MRLLRVAGLPALALALSIGPAQPAVAQINTAVTVTDVQRLQDDIYDATRDITQLRSRDSVLASQLERDLDDVRDDIGYLKVKLRRNESIARSEFSDVRDRIDNIRSRARGDSTEARDRHPAAGSPSDRQPPPVTGRAHNPKEIPVDHEFDIRLPSGLSSQTALVEDRCEATTMVDLRDGEKILVPAGSIVRGTV